MQPVASQSMETVVVGARGSRLAQAMVRELIDYLAGCPVVQFKAKSVMTSGDKDRKTSVRELAGGEGGLFTTQLEQELMAGRVDVAVHSLKDLPTRSLTAWCSLSPRCALIRWTRCAGRLWRGFALVPGWARGPPGGSRS